jgi:hypothetical protein
MLLAKDEYRKGRMIYGAPHPASNASSLTKSATPSPPTEAQGCRPGAATALQVALRRACDAVNVPVQTIIGHELPLADEQDHTGELLIGGWCAVWNVVDGSRHSLAVNSLGWHAYDLPKVQYRHQGKVVGTLRSLEANNYGLFCQILTADPLARRAPSLSASFAVGEYELRNAGSKDVHAYIRSGWLTEISLSTQPANPFCRIVSRLPAKSALSRQNELMIEHMKLLMRLVEIQRAA